ncbi:hypothetical protein P3T27_005854 [Kitasatospora sp. MAA19]|nr:hypothetical protein [Kitasatospora sp. MAA19]
MPATPSGTARPDQERHRRLASQLNDMIPGADTLRISLTDPNHRWPHPHASAVDMAGHPIPITRVTAKVASRWVLRTWPDADWSLPHTLDLGTAELALAGRGR